MQPSKFQIDCIDFALKADGSHSEFVPQIRNLRLKYIEHTGVGCFYNYELLHDDSLNDKNQNETIVIDGGFHLETDSLPYGASITVWIRNGRIDTLEILAHGSTFPVDEPEYYTFREVPVNFILDIKTSRS